MSKFFFRTLVLATVGLSIFNTSIAADYPAAIDTSGKLLLANNLPHKPEGEMIIRAANVTYPAILVGNEQQSLDYIEAFATTRKAYLLNIFKRSKKLFPKVETILKKHHVPVEFRVLLALESGFNANAVSPAGAVGYWQIMDEVAKEYGLKIPVKVQSSKQSKIPAPKLVALDERKNFLKSTTAAARYLQDRCRNLGNDWLLIAASYNCGVGNVWNAMQRSGKATPTFWDIRQFLPAETRAYVMNFITLNVIFHNFDAYSKNTLCFRDVTCKVIELEENASDNAPPSMLE